MHYCNLTVKMISIYTRTLESDIVDQKAQTLSTAERIESVRLAEDFRLQNFTAFPVTTVVESDFIKTWVVVVQMFHEAYIYPVFIVVTLFANILIAGVFLRPSAKRCGTTTRVYYLIIAFSDICYSVDFDFLANFAVSDLFVM